MANFKELIEKKNDMITRAEGVLNKAKEEKRELTPDEAAEIAEIRDNVRNIVDTLNLDDDIKNLDDTKTKKDDTTPTNAGGDDVNTDDKTQQTRALDERAAFENYIRGYEVHERAGELTKSDNGAIIPTTIANEIMKKVYDVCPILEQSTKYNVKGTLEIPVYTDGITVAFQDEFKQLTSTNGSFASISLTGYLAGALSKISRSLINNSQFDIVSFVVNQMGEDIARFIENVLLNGATSKIDGLSNLTNVLTTASATAITADEIVDLHDTIKDTYQNGAIWIMNSSTRTALRKLKDKEDRYILNDDISSPFGTTLLGKPVYCSDNMPKFKTAGKPIIYYGNMKGLATKFNEDVNIQILRERYADEHAVGVIGWFEFDAKVQNNDEIAVLKMKSGS